MRFLRSNIAQRVGVGPFFNVGDGITPALALTVTSCKLTLIGDIGNFPTLILDAFATASGGTNDMVHISGDDAGFYDLELTASQLNFMGRCMLSINDIAAHRPVVHEFMVIPQQVYDSLILGTDLLDVTKSKLAVRAVVQSGTTQTVLQLDRGDTTADRYKGYEAVIIDVSDTSVPKRRDSRRVNSSQASDLGAVLELTINRAPSFTMTTGDIVELYMGALDGLDLEINAQGTAEIGVAVAANPTMVADFASLKRGGDVGVQSEVVSASSPTTFVAASTGLSTVTGAYVGQFVDPTEGDFKGQSKEITAYNGSTFQFTVLGGWANNLAAGTNFTIIGKA